MLSNPRTIEQDEYRLLTKHRPVEIRDIEYLSKLWSDYIGTYIDFEKLFNAVSTYRWNNLYSLMYAKPHMEGMIDVFIKYSNFEVLRIPVSVYEDKVLVHTIQGTIFQTLQALDKLKAHGITLRSIGISFIDHLNTIAEVLFQRPDHNIWHREEMERRVRREDSREFSIYESIIRNYYKARTIKEFYDLLNRVNSKEIVCVNGLYYPAPNDLTVPHPTYLLRKNQHGAYFMVMDDVIGLYRFNGNMLVKISFIPVSIAN